MRRAGKNIDLSKMYMGVILKKGDVFMLELESNLLQALEYAKENEGKLLQTVKFERMNEFRALERAGYLLLDQIGTGFCTVYLTEDGIEYLEN